MKAKTKKQQGKSRAVTAPPAKSQRAPAPLNDWLVPLAVAVVSFVAFWPALTNQFVDWDDNKMIMDNLQFRGLGLDQLRWMVTTFHMGHYQPLSWITLALDYQLWGMEPFGYHLTNLVLHSANAVLFYFLARRLLAIGFSLAIGNPPDLKLRIAAMLAALLFALHPLRVESVAWATERRDVLSGLFFLATLLAYVRGATVDPHSAFKWKAAAFGFFTLSLLAKATAITLPVVLVVLDFYPLKRLSGAVGSWFGPRARTVWLEKIPFFVLAAMMGGLALAAQSHAGAMYEMEAHNSFQRLAQAFYGLQFYLWKTLWPFHLSALYEFPVKIEPLALPFVTSALVVIAITASFFWLRCRCPALLAVWISYAAILGPVLGIAQSGPQLVADRYSYLSCLGWAVLAGAGFLWFSRSVKATKLTDFTLAMASALGVLVVVFLGVLTWQQTQVWHDTKHLWTHALSINRRSLFQSGGVQHNLGLFLVGQRDLSNADALFREALRINPSSVKFFNDAGVALERQGKLNEAFQLYEAALKVAPNAIVLNNLAGILLRRGEVNRAVERYRQALALTPRDSELHLNLANALVRSGALGEAVQQYKIAVQIRPGFAEAYHNLGRVMAAQGRLDLAIGYFRQALQVRPDYVEARRSLEMALSEMGQSR